jgi:hypothetical protein
MTAPKIEMFAGWLANGERGISSEAIVAKLTGVSVGRHHWNKDHPHDMGDFARCEKLLRRVDVARLLLPEMSTVSPEWAILVARWDELVKLAESEVPGVFEGARGGTPLANALIRGLLAEARAA